MHSPDEFPLRLPDTKEGQDTIRSRLAAWRRNRAYRLGKRCTFNYDRRFDKRVYSPCYPYDPDYPPCRPSPEACAHFSWPRRRDVPAIFREGKCAFIQITKALSVGLDRNAQVFAGILGAPGDPLATPVAVKIYRPSQMDPKTWKILKADPPVFGDHTAVQMQAFKQEFWTYTQMAPLQGTVIPHVYGFLELDLSNDEHCVVLVMEYIENVDHDEYISLLGLKNTEAMADLGNGLAMAIHAVHTCGVSLLDLAARNVLVPRAHPNFPIFVDFGDTGAVEETGLNIYAIEIFKVLSQVGFDSTKASKWELAQENDPAWI